MARTVEDIRSEDDALKAEGVHHFDERRRTLLTELKALGSGRVATKPKRKKKAPVSPLVAAATITGAGVPYNVGVDFAKPDPFETEEWQFIKKAASEIHVPKDGIASGLFKHLYTELKYKVAVWRLAREMVEERGIGGEWPQFNKLNRCPNKGTKLDAKPEKQAAEPTPEAPAPAKTGAEMPLHLSKPEDDAIFAAHGGDPAIEVREAISSREQPVAEAKI